MHGNSQKRYYIPSATYFITTVTNERYPYFGEEILCRLMADHIEFAKNLMGFSLSGYAIMPDHMHLLIRPNGTSNHSQIMFSVKKQFAHNANCVMGYNAVYDEGAKTFSRLRSYRDEFIISRPAQCAHPPFRWHKSFHDHIIRDERDHRNHIRYIVRQREKHGAPGCVWVADA